MCGENAACNKTRPRLNTDAQRHRRDWACHFAAVSAASRKGREGTPPGASASSAPPFSSRRTYLASRARPRSGVPRAALRSRPPSSRAPRGPRTAAPSSHRCGVGGPRSRRACSQCPPISRRPTHCCAALPSNAAASHAHVMRNTEFAASRREERGGHGRGGAGAAAAAARASPPRPPASWRRPPRTACERGGGGGLQLASRHRSASRRCLLRPRVDA